MNNEIPISELIDQLSNWGLHFLAGALTESINSKGAFTEADLRFVVESAKSVPMFLKVPA